MNPSPDHETDRRGFQVSCERCRKRKIKCDRIYPCSRCTKADVECTLVGSGEKRRPVSRGYVQALEGQIASLEKFITNLIAAEGPQRDEMLANFGKSSDLFQPQTTDSTMPITTNTLEIPIRPRLEPGHLRKVKDGNATEFYGPTSLFQIGPSDHDTEPAPDYPTEPSGNLSFQEDILKAPVSEILGNPNSPLVFSPQSNICRALMATFFKHQYQYHMCLYREYFLRDFDAGSGPYYSDLLMYAICAIGALASEEIALRELSDVFTNRAQQLLYGSALESPNLTTLQALILLGHREIGQGKTSKGWIFSGMAFRLAHEMGLHLDPNNWNGSGDSDIDREILRRTYWAAFVADKQLSLYFGRPPALYPSQSDVIDTIRIPYPPEWESLLNTYIMKGTSETAYEDGMALVAAFVQQVELCKILHRIIIEVFENRGANSNEIILAKSIKDIDVALTKWSTKLPAKLHWSQWSVGPIPPLVLHLHMMYHNSMILLHRPPRGSFRRPEVAEGEDVQICYESLENIMKLLRIYSKQYQFCHLPLTFIHILASAASVILMKRYILMSSWDDIEVSKPLGLVVEALDGVSQTWPCAKQVLSVIKRSMESTTEPGFRNISPESFDVMTGLSGIGVSNDIFPHNEFDFEVDSVDIGLYMTEDFLNNPFLGTEWSAS